MGLLRTGCSLEEHLGLSKQATSNPPLTWAASSQPTHRGCQGTSWSSGLMDTQSPTQVLTLSPLAKDLGQSLCSHPSENDPAFLAETQLLRPPGTVLRSQNSLPSQHRLSVATEGE